MVEVAAGEPWDEVVARAIDEEWSGIEALSGIPGSSGRDPAAERRRLRPGGRPDDRAGCACSTAPTGRSARWPPPDCALRLPVQRRSGTTRAGSSSRSTFQLRLGAQPPRSATPSWPGRSASRGARASRRETYGRPSSSCAAARACSSTPATTTRGAPGRSSSTRSWAPTPPRRLPPDAPRYPAVDGGIKTSAAWLVEQAGFARGWGDGRGPRLDQALPRPDQPRRGDDRRASSRSPRTIRRRRPGPVRRRPRAGAQLVGCSRLDRGVQPGVDAGEQPGLDVGRAREPRPTAGPARPAPRRCSPVHSRASSYWAASRDPKSSGSSAPSATRAPASSRVRSGTSSGAS